MKLVSLIISSLVVFLVGCGSSKGTAPMNQNLVPTAERVERAKPSEHHQLSIRFQNERGEVVIQLDPDAEDLYLEFHGGKMEKESGPENESKTNTKDQNQNSEKSEKKEFMNALDSVFKGEKANEKLQSGEGLENLEGIAKEDAQAIVELLGKAQAAFYAKDFEKAEELLGQSLKIVPTARAYAMLGSMGLVQGNRVAARGYWKKSLELDDSQEKVKKALYNLESK
jgi:tetratricopeptide (TPR) repeat protein